MKSAMQPRHGNQLLYVARYYIVKLQRISTRMDDSQERVGQPVYWSAAAAVAAEAGIDRADTVVACTLRGVQGRSRAEYRPRHSLVPVAVVGSRVAEAPT